MASYAGMSAQALNEQKKKNSAAWHTDPANRAKYEAENKSIMAELDRRSGTTSTLDTTTGTWSTKPASSGGGSSGGSSGSKLSRPLDDFMRDDYVPEAPAAQQTPKAPVQQIQQPQKQVSVTDSPEYKSLLGELDSLRGQLQQSKSDYSDYVKQLQEAAKEKSLAELEAAYKKNVNAIDAAKGQIAPQYTDARNQVAGQAAVGRKNWQETASALGINSGAAGQSDIAQNLAMQNNLAALDKAESADMAALDLQRTQAVTDYNSAIAKAEADGDYALASSLYQEKVRADEAARAAQATQFQQMLQQLQFEYGMGQDALTQQNWEQSRQDSLAQQGWNNRYQEEQAEAAKQTQSFNNLLTLVSSFAESTGDYSLFGQFGFTPEQISAWNGAWAQQHDLELQQAYAKIAAAGKTGSGTTKPTLTASQAAEALKSGMVNPTTLAAYKYYYGADWAGDGGTGYTDPYEAMRAAGIYDAAGAYAWALNNGSKSEEAAKLAEFFGTRTPITDDTQLGETARIIAGMAKRVMSDDQLDVIGKQIKDALAKGDITGAEADYITKEILHYG